MRHASIAVLAVAIVIPTSFQARSPGATRAASDDPAPRLACPMPVHVPRGQATMPVAIPDSTLTLAMPVAPPKCANPMFAGDRSDTKASTGAMELLDRLDYGFRTPGPSGRR